MRGRLAPSILFLLVATTSWAQSQNVRVLATDAAIRLNPEQQSTVLMNVPPGTVLEVSGERRGEWYPVILPPDASGLRRSGYVLATAVEPVSQPGTRAATPATASPAGTPTTSASDWQRTYDQALAKRRGGRAKFWAGWGVFGAGAFLHAIGQRQDCSQYQTPYIPGQGIYFGEVCRTHSEPMKWAGIGSEIGGMTFVFWGGSQTADANRQIRALEAVRPSEAVSFRIDLKPGVQLQASTGARSSSMALMVRW